MSRPSQHEVRNAALIDLVEAVEARGRNAFIASILVLDGNKLRHAAGPGLPADYRDAVNGIEIGPANGSCGTAAYCGHPIYVADIATDLLWARWPDIKDMALEAGLRACWSMPITCNDKVLGTFAIYHREPRSPTEAERNLIVEAAQFAAVLLDGVPRDNASKTEFDCGIDGAAATPSGVRRRVAFPAAAIPARQ